MGWCRCQWPMGGGNRRERIGKTQWREEKREENEKLGKVKSCRRRGER